MIRRPWIVLAVIVFSSTFAFGRGVDRGLAETIIRLERGALDRWGKGDPEGYLELYARDVTYFDPSHDGRIDGAQAMRRALEPIKGLIHIDRYEMIAPRVDGNLSVAILTYNLVTYGRGPDGAPAVRRWNSTGVCAGGRALEDRSQSLVLHKAVSRRLSIASLVVAAATVTALAQPSARLSSPEVLAGNRVVFRLRAPVRARCSAEVNGEW